MAFIIQKLGLSLPLKRIIIVILKKKWYQEVDEILVAITNPDKYKQRKVGSIIRSVVDIFPLLNLYFIIL